MAACRAEHTTKNAVLLQIAQSLDSQSEEILAANQLDMQQAQESGMSGALQDRLLLTLSVYKLSLMMSEKFVN